MPFKTILNNLLKARILLNDTIIVIESEKNTEIAFPSLMRIFDERKYGKTKITFLSINFN